MRSDGLRKIRGSKGREQAKKLERVPLGLPGGLRIRPSS